MSDNVEQFLNAEIGADEALVPVSAEEPLTYRVDANSRIPVSKHQGKLWEGRIKSGEARRKLHVAAWDEAMQYYNNNQQGHRSTEGGTGDRSGNRYFAKRRNTKWSETENVVYSNVRAMMPALYAKNPQVEFTTYAEEHKPFVQKLESVVNILAQRPHAPGLNLKTHAKQAVICAELCNIGWLEYGYVERTQSSEAVLPTIDALSTELAEAKELKIIREIEGKLIALDEQVALATPSGPFVKYRKPHDVVADPDAEAPDFSDARWLAVRDVYMTSYLNAKYGEKDENGTIKSTYDPTHVLLSASEGEEDTTLQPLGDNAADGETYGYSDKRALEKAQRTLCWRIYDRVTRRVYLYADNKWDWPIWVEADPYGLPNMFPLEPLVFNTTPSGAYAHSNVTYYLDQQDAINEINDEKRRGRQDIRENILYDDRFERESVVKWISGSNDKAVGVSVPEGKTLKEMILPKPNVMLGALPLFDAEPIMRAVDRISGVSDAMRNAQYKTNTTNKAIESYNSTTAMRLDEKIDAIEETVGRVMFGVAFCCAQFMSAEDVTNLAGQALAEGWNNYTSQELRGMFSATSIGGSTQKPTSQAKKQQAMELAQTLEKFAQFAPGTILETILQLFDEAFDDLTLPANAFVRIREEVAEHMKKGQTDVPPGANAAPPGGMDGNAGASPNAGTPSIEQLALLVDSLPPQAKEALGIALSRDVPVMEALPQIIRLVEQSQQGPVQ